jgi:hypothetical protein
VISPVVCGAHIVVYINSRLYARVSSISFQTAEPQREIVVVDSLDVAEEAPAAVIRRVSLQVYRLHGDGGAEGAGLAVPQRDMPVQKYGSILVLDRTNDLVIYRSDRVKLTQQGWQIGRGLVTGSLSANALDASNEVAAAT